MLKRIPIIAANWKMYKTAAEAQEFLTHLKGKLPSSVKVFIAPSFTALPVVKGAQGVVIGAQNMHEADEGAFTGEISARMLKDAGVQFVIVGHSERRRLFHETDAVVHLKLKKAFSSQLLPILCVGETLEDREARKTFDVLSHQLKTALAGTLPAELILAYEPVWAIGAGETATPETAADAHRLIRAQVKGSFGAEAANNIRILYGGSVKPDNAKSLMAQPEIDGFLVGGASLDPVSFASIVNR